MQLKGHKLCPLFIYKFTYIIDLKFCSIYLMYNYIFGGESMLEIKNLTKKFGYDNSFNNNVSYVMRNSVTDILDSVHDIIETMAKIFIYVSIVVTAFASLLLMNFISISINYKSKGIGILRAVGARSGDVFIIFFNESLIIASINFVLTTAVAAAGVYLINYILRYNFGLILTLLVFSVRQVCLILAISLVVAFISTFFPVMHIARKKPVEAIKM